MMISRAMLLAGALLTQLMAPSWGHGAFFTPPLPAPPPVVEKPAPSPAPLVPAAPGQPGSSPGSGAPPAPAAQAQGGSAPATPGTLPGVDLGHWSYWWYFNRDGLLRTRERLMAALVSSGGGPGGVRPQVLPSQGVVEQLVVPSLLEAIRTASYDGVVSAAAVALGRSSSAQRARIAAGLDELMAARDPQVREAALLARGLLGELDGATLLIRVLDEDPDLRKQLGRKPDDRMRAFAVYGLALLAEESPIREVRRMALLHLLRVLEDQREPRDLRVAVAVALGSMTLAWGPEQPAGAELPSQVRNRQDLARVLLAAQEAEDEDIVRAHLVVALGELFEDPSAPEPLRADVAETLMEALEARQAPDVRNGLLIALGHLGSSWGRATDKDVRDFLQAASLDGKGGQRDAHARHMALMAFAEVSSRSDGPAPPPDAVRATFEAAIVERLRSAGEVEASWLSLAAASYGARCQARGLELGPELRAGLVDVLRGGGSADRLSTAMLALGLSGCTGETEEVRRVLGKSGNPSVRGYAALALGLLGDEESTDELSTLLYANRYQAQALEHTALGLAFLNRSKANEQLRDLLGTARSQTLAGGIAVAIGRVSDPAAVQYLAPFVASDDTSSVLRSFCTVALGLIADPRDLPWRVHLSEGLNYAAWSPTLFDVAGMGVLNIL